MKRLTILMALALTACSNEPAPPLAVTGVELTKPMPGMSMSAGYLILSNASSDATTITHVSSPQFGSVEMHETRIEDGISRMRKLPELVVEPGSEVVFERGGKHLMLMRPADDLSNVTLNFYSGDALLLSVAVSD